MTRRRAAAAAAAVAVVAVVLVLVLQGGGDGRRTAVAIRTAAPSNGLPGLVHVERDGSRHVVVRPEWATWSRKGPRTGLLVQAVLRGPRAFVVRAWSAPGQPGWAVVPMIRGARAVTVRALGTTTVAGVVRPRGWDVTWKGGIDVPRGASLVVDADRTKAARPWDSGAPDGDGAEVVTSLGACDGSDAPPGCGEMPSRDSRSGGP